MENSAVGTGTLIIIIGGAEDKHWDCSILKYAVEKIGGQNSHLLILITATEKPEEVGSNYRKVFEFLGTGSIDVSNIDSRHEANNEESVQKLNNCS